jgi:hypothetical protein
MLRSREAADGDRRLVIKFPSGAIGKWADFTVARACLSQSPSLLLNAAGGLPFADMIRDVPGRGSATLIFNNSNNLIPALCN